MLEFHLSRHQERKNFEVCGRLIARNLFNRLFALVTEVQQQRLHELLVQQVTCTVPVAVRVTLKGVLVDLPEVVADAPSLETSKFADRCKIVARSALEAVPTGGDLYMIKRVMMGFSDDDAGVTLRNCCAAMRADSRVLVIDPMLPNGTEPHYNRLTDILMLVVPGAAAVQKPSFASCLTQPDCL
jgi:hypothetical protein